MSYEIPEDLIKKIKNNEVIPFVGAGISTGVMDKNDNPLFLNWKDLLLSSVEMLKKSKKYDESQCIMFAIKTAKTAKDYLHIADKIKEFLSSEWKTFLEINFKKSYDNVNYDTLKIPKEIWNLNKLVITTNYDKVMHWACNDKDLVTWNIKSTAGQLDSLKNKTKDNILWHLHGKIDEIDDIILTTSSYEKLYVNNSEKEVVTYTLKTHLATKSFIFLGFSLDDIYIKEQLKFIKKLFNDNTGPHYILIKEKYKNDLSGLGDIRPIFIKNYKEDYLRVLKELSGNEILPQNNQNINTSGVEKKPIRIPFSVPFVSKEEGAIGIEEKLNEVNKMLTSSSKTNIGQLASFQGMGGLGKTQLAVEYAYKYKELYDGVVWLTIDLDIDEQIIELAEKCFWINNDIDSEIKLRIAKKKFFELTNILLILDNVDNKEQIEIFSQRLSRNKILITSRNPIQGFKSIPLDTLNEDDSLMLLSVESNRNIEEFELEYAKKVALELDGLPLALEMAGAYVEYSNLNWEEYFELYQEEGISFLEESDIRSFTNHENKIAKTLSLSDTLLKENPLLNEIIYLLAWGANEPIDKNLISIMLDEKLSSIVKSISMGLKLKFIKRSEDGFILHRLVKDIWKEKEKINIDFSNKVSTNLSNYMKEIKDDFLKLKELDKSSIQAKTWVRQINDKYLKASLVSHSVYPDYHRGKYNIALKEVNSIFELLKNEDDSYIYAEILNNKGFLTQAMGKLKEAKPFYIKALEMRERLYSDADHEDIANSLSNMGSILDLLGKKNESKDFYIQALEMNKRLYTDTDNIHIADSLNNMGYILDLVGKKEESKDFHIQSLEMNKRLHPNTNHPSIAISLSNMGYVLYDLGRKEESKDFHIQSHEMNKRLYPDADHPSIATSFSNMGSMLKKRKEVEASKNYYIKALEMRERLYPDTDHPNLADSLNSLGLITKDKDYFKKAYKMSERLYGKTDNNTVMYLCSYASLAYMNIGTKNYAISLLENYKKALKGNNNLLYEINKLLNETGSKIGRNNSKRKNK